MGFIFRVLFIARERSASAIKNEKNKSHIARAVTAITGLSHGSKINESEEVKARRVVSKPVHFVNLIAHTIAKDKQNNAIASFI